MREMTNEELKAYENSLDKLFTDDIEDFWWLNVLYGADENCEHEIVNADGGGAKCLKCKGWFCF